MTDKSQPTNARCEACGEPATRTDIDGVPLCEADYWHLTEHWRLEIQKARRDVLSFGVGLVEVAPDGVTHIPLPDSAYMTAEEAAAYLGGKLDDE